MSSLAPIVLFVFNRPWHTEQTLIALSKNTLAPKSKLYVYADGARNDATAETKDQVLAVRNIVLSQQWCREVELIERPANLGLAENVIQGVTEVVNRHGKIIVLEDDLVTSPYFLQYCNDGLNMYAHRPDVYAINAFQFALPLQEADTFLSPLGIGSWGWATWQDRWQIFEREPAYAALIEEDPYLKQRFNFGGYNYSNMLHNRNSWAIRWYYSVFIRNGLGLFPTHSLVTNIGFDGSGIHGKNDVAQRAQEIYEAEYPVVLKEKINAEYLSIAAAFFAAYEKAGRRSLPRRAASYIYRSLKKMFKNNS